jgi:hypothetical protein
LGSSTGDQEGGVQSWKGKSMRFIDSPLKAIDNDYDVFEINISRNSLPKSKLCGLKQVGHQYLKKQY